MNLSFTVSPYNRLPSTLSPELFLLKFSKLTLPVQHNSDADTHVSGGTASVRLTGHCTIAVHSTGMGSGTNAGPNFHISGLDLGMGLQCSGVGQSIQGRNKPFVDLLLLTAFISLGLLQLPPILPFQLKFTLLSNPSLPAPLFKKLKHELI